MNCDDEMVWETADVKTCEHGHVFALQCPFCLKAIMDIVKRTAANTCCLCCDPCLSCDAKDVLKMTGMKR